MRSALILVTIFIVVEQVCDFTFLGAATFADGSLNGDLGSRIVEAAATPSTLYVVSYSYTQSTHHDTLKKQYL